MGWKAFPGGPGVKNPPASAGDAGSTLSLGSFHMPKPTHSAAVLHSERNHCNEKPAHRKEE